jgi:hypothetical protein
VGKKSFLRTTVLLIILILVLAMVSQTVSALTAKNVKTWCWNSLTEIYSVARGDVDGDGKTELVTGGWYLDSGYIVAQLCVLDGATLALENVKTWYWTGSTNIWSVAVGDADSDGKNEIITGGDYAEGTSDFAQVCLWNGQTLALENVQTWNWANHTYIRSVVVGDVDVDGKAEIVTGGFYSAPVSTSYIFVAVVRLDLVV